MSTAPGPLGLLIATELRAELGRQNKSRRWLAEQIGTPHNTVSRWVGGETCPPLDSIDLMCEALGLNIVEVMAGAKCTLGIDQSRARWESTPTVDGGIRGRRASDFRTVGLHAACAA